MGIYASGVATALAGQPGRLVWSAGNRVISGFLNIGAQSEETVAQGLKPAFALLRLRHDFTACGKSGRVPC
jgi:hypothetical protein